VELLALYRQTRDKEHVGVLYKRYAHLVFGLCMKYFKDEDQAADAVTNIFTKLFDDLLKHKVEYFKSWLYTYSKNHCLMTLRSAKSNLRKSLEYSANFKVVMENSEEMHQNANKREQEYALLEQALTALSDEQRVCVELFYLKDKSYAQITEITGHDLNKVKSHIQNGKRNLKIMLEQNNNAGQQQT
ncbi:MAG TPA: sigma-70 family RNA polymerase sigma factor, partial [Bacteroidia bacterium]|nr:sigma-70 family RNA polymerase sigma factor [Bacteroidia bacterium]